MAYARTLVFAAAVGVIAVVGWSGPAVPSAHTGPPGFEFVRLAGVADKAAAQLSGAQRAEIETVLALFADAGLTLPKVSIYVHDTSDGCNGHNGVYSRGGDKKRIDICLFHQYVLRHELAHAWEYHALGDVMRVGFMNRTGLDVWNDWSKSHDMRGIERAAKLIAWGVAAEPIQFMHRHLYAENLALYEFLTGMPSPRIAHWENRPAPARGTLPADGPVTPAFATTRN